MSKWIEALNKSIQLEADPIPKGWLKAEDIQKVFKLESAATFIRMKKMLHQGLLKREKKLRIIATDGNIRWAQFFSIINK